MARDFEGKTVLVTGGGSGIGRATALALGAGGANVVVNDLSRESAHATADDIQRDGGTAFAIAGDVGKPDDVKASVDAAVAQYGALNLAFNNAGIVGPSGPLTDIEIDAYLALMDVDLHSVFYGMRYEIPEMLAAGGGAIVNTSSVLGLLGNANAVPYVTAKHGVAGMTKAAALEYAGRGIRINSVHPGYIATPLIGEVPEEIYDVMAGLHPIGRLGRAEEVANVVLFLLSDEAAFVTGAQYVVDGGYASI